MQQERALTGQGCVAWAPQILLNTHKSQSLTLDVLHMLGGGAHLQTCVAEFGCCVRFAFGRVSCIILCKCSRSWFHFPSSPTILKSTAWIIRWQVFLLRLVTTTIRPCIPNATYFDQSGNISGLWPERQQHCNLYFLFVDTHAAPSLPFCSDSTSRDWYIGWIWHRCISSTAKHALSDFVLICCHILQGLALVQRFVQLV